MTGHRREARDALAAAGVRPQKRWGQNFLCDPEVAARIVDRAGIGPTTAVLEIGPGLGALTEPLAARAAALWVVEIDRRLADRLTAMLADRPHVRVVTGDVLRLPLGEIVTAPEATVVANLPYSVSTPVLFRLLDLRAQFPRALLMLQAEVAERLAAAPGDAGYGVTSVLVQAWADVSVAFHVASERFHPRPEVDSAVIDVRWSPTPRADIGDPATFRAVVRAAFGQRRKMLHNALAGAAGARGLDAAALGAAFARAGVEPTARAETLDVAAFGRLSRALGTGR